MIKIKSFLRTTFFGGFLVVLPIIVSILVLIWLFEFLTDKIRPITIILIQTTRLNELIASILSIVIILLIFFIVGLLVQTRAGKIIIHMIEEGLLKRIPFYKIIKDTTVQLFGGEKLIFKYAALVKPFSNDTMILGFVTDESSNGYVTVFIPSAPAPTGGYIYTLKKENIIKLDYPVEQMMKVVLSLGAGSREFLSKL
ncbi:DUF502 domain-containing protein [Rosettibacter firmus]|uniref:DUF502 domain-containing protein n=1 Tax=Rosettibacter firmus TaxID=3111522 RepID=UPI00336C1544